MKIYNTLSGKKEILKPIKGKKINLFVCGPTVYDYSHIGHARTYVSFDSFVKYLRELGYKVFYLQNITDLDDKIIARAREKGVPPKDLADAFGKEHLKNMKSLGVDSVTKYAKATSYIKQIISQIKRLQKKGFTYKIEGDGIYYSIGKFKNYGKLARLNFSGMKAGARVDVDNYEKENPADFVLWKAWTPKDGPVFWQTPLGKGRPGWHIECSVISMKELGQPFDIHAGGVDLIFPHHENEIAQSEAALNKPFVKYWLHGEHLLVNNQKMAKSLNNFFTLRDLITRHFNPLAFRYLLLTTHYRSKLNFTLEALEAAERGLEHLHDVVRKLKQEKKINNKNREIDGDNKMGDKRYEIRDKFLEAINDDLDTPGALAIVWEAIKNNLIDYKTLLTFDKVLGLGLDKAKTKKTKIPVVVQKLLNARAIARAEKDWKESDRLREEIKKIEFEVQDSADGGQTVVEL